MAPEYYVFTGRDGERVPWHVTHVLIAKALKFVPARAFMRHPNIQEVICHDGLVKIGKYAFYKCPSLRRIVMPGVKDIEASAFYHCESLTCMECGKLERIGEYAFVGCTSLSSIDLPSIKIVREDAFTGCKNLINANFGKELESIGGMEFYRCTSLERVTIPLKMNLFADDNVFLGCKKLNHVDLVGGVYETIAALLMEEWKRDMNEEIGTVNRILPNTPSGDWTDVGEKVRTIRTWISSVLHKYNNYKAQHHRYLNEAAAILQRALPNDILFKNVLPFVELPSDTFGGED